MEKVSKILILILYSAHCISNNLSDHTFQSHIQTMQNIVNSDVVSPSLAREFIETAALIDTYGNSEQKNFLMRLIGNNEEKVQKMIEIAVHSSVVNEKIKSAVKLIGMITLQGALAVATFESLKLLAGNQSVEAAENAIMSAAISGAIANLYAYAENPRLHTNVLQSTYAGAASSIIYKQIADFSAGEKPISGLATAGTIKASLVAMAVDVISKMVERQGGAMNMLERFDWAPIMINQRDRAEQEIITSNSEAFNFLVKIIGHVVRNKTVKKVVASTVLAACQGALVATLMQQIGLGYADESTFITSISYSALRGGIDALMNYAVFTRQQMEPGLVGALTTGFFAKNIQKLVTAGTKLTKWDITPLIVEKVTTSALDQVVEKSGGWVNTMKNIISSAVSIPWWNPIEQGKRF